MREKGEVPVGDSPVSSEAEDSDPEPSPKKPRYVLACNRASYTAIASTIVSTVHTLFPFLVGLLRNRSPRAKKGRREWLKRVPRILILRWRRSWNLWEQKKMRQLEVMKKVNNCVFSLFSYDQNQI